MKRVAIVGGGIAGLATAVHLEDAAASLPGGLEVVVLEGQDRLGGNLRTEEADGFTIEWGPNGFLDNVPATAALVGRLGLAEQLQRADETAANRFLFRNGRLHLLPSGALSFLGCPVLSLRGRLRVLLEPWAAAAADGDETIYAFARRRIGDEAARVLIDAMVSGVFAGDIHRLSLASTFPRMAKMEAEHGGLVRAMIAKGRERRQARRRAAQLAAAGKPSEELTRPGGPAGPGGTLTSFRHGIEILIDGAAATLAGSVQLRWKVDRLEPAGANGGPRWRLASAGRTLEADAVVLAQPAAASATLLTALDADLANAFTGITTAPLAVVALGYRAAELDATPDGFGFLVPRGEGPRILGCLWDSSIFPGRAPDGHVLLRAMIGGAHDRQVMQLEDDEILTITRADLATTMGLTAAPMLTRVIRHRAGIAQYEVGHAARLAAIEERLSTHAGLWLAGSSYFGVAMNACIEHAEKLAAEVVAAME